MKGMEEQRGPSIRVQGLRTELGLQDKGKARKPEDLSVGSPSPPRPCDHGWFTWHARTFLIPDSRDLEWGRNTDHDDHNDQPRPRRPSLQLDSLAGPVAHVPTPSAARCGRGRSP